jgi:hypothetical protein
MSSADDLAAFLRARFGQGGRAIEIHAVWAQRPTLLDATTFIIEWSAPGVFFGRVASMVSITDEMAVSLGEEASLLGLALLFEREVNAQLATVLPPEIDRQIAVLRGEG